MKLKDINPLQPQKVKPKHRVGYGDLNRRKQQRLDGFIKNNRITEYLEE